MSYPAFPSNGPYIQEASAFAVAPNAPPAHYEPTLSALSIAKAKDWTPHQFQIAPPSWYQSRQIVTILKYVLAGTTFVTAGVTFYASLYSKGTPAEVLRKVKTLGLATVSLLGITLGICFKKEFWKDPAYLNDKGSEIWNKLREMNPSFKVMQQAFPSVILNALKPEDYNELLQEDALTLDYHPFVKKHGAAALDMLGSENKDRLSSTLFDKLEGLNQLDTVEWNKLGLVKQRFIQVVLSKEIALLQAGKINYTTFKNRNTGYLTLCPNQQDMQGLFIENIVSSSQGVVALKAAFADEFAHFNIGDHLLVPLLWEKQKKELTTFSAFETKHGFNYFHAILMLLPQDQPLFKAALLKEPLPSILYHQDASKILSVCSQDITDTLLAELQLESTHYAAFKNRHGIDLLKYIPNKGPSKIMMEEALSRLCLNVGGAEFVRSYSVEMDLYGVSLQKLAIGHHATLLKQFQARDSWRTFYNLHGNTFVQELIQISPALKNLLKTSFLLSPQVINHEAFCTVFGVTAQEFSFAICNIASTLTFEAFKKQIGITTLLSGATLIPDDSKKQLREKFFNEFVEKPPVGFSDEEERGLGFSMNKVLLMRWKDKSVIEIHKADPQHFIAQLNNPAFFWSEKVEQEIANIKLEDILTKYPSVIFDQVLPSNSKNLQKAIVDFYVRNFLFFYTADSHPTLEAMQKLNIVPDATFTAQMTQAKLTFATESARIQQNLQNIDSELNTKIKTAEENRDKSIASLKGQIKSQKSLISEAETNIKSLQFQLSRDQGRLTKALTADETIKATETSIAALKEKHYQEETKFKTLSQELLEQEAKFQKLQADSKQTEVTGLRAAFTATTAYAKELKEVKDIRVSLNQKISAENHSYESTLKQYEELLSESKLLKQKTLELSASVRKIPNEIKAKEGSLNSLKLLLGKIEMSYEVEKRKADLECTQIINLATIHADMQKAELRNNQQNLHDYFKMTYLTTLNKV